MIDSLKIVKIRYVTIDSKSANLPTKSIFISCLKVPQGHMVQQILDPNGTLQHVILTPDPMLSQQQQQQQPPPQQSHHGVPITPYVSTVKIYTMN